MSIDRRIVSILYYNNIFDIDEVEKFIGEKDDYYEVIINGEVKNLKIPGKDYFDEISTEYELEKFPEKEKVAERSFEEELLEVEKDAKKFQLFTIKEEIFFEEEMKKSEEENDLFLEKIKEKEPEVKKISEVKKPEVKKTSTIKKEKKVVTKKDIDDFMDII